MGGGCVVACSGVLGRHIYGLGTQQPRSERVRMADWLQNNVYNHATVHIQNTKCMKQFSRLSKGGKNGISRDFVAVKLYNTKEITQL